VLCARSTSCSFFPSQLCDSVGVTDTPYHERLVLKSSTDRFCGLAALPSVVSVDYTDVDSNADGKTLEEAQLVMMTSGLMMKAAVDVEKVMRFKAE